MSQLIDYQNNTTHIALTGHRPNALGWSYDLNTTEWLKLKVILRTLLYDALKTYPHLTIHIGGSLGGDTVWADVAYVLRDQHHQPIHVHMHIPGNWQESKWPDNAVRTWQKHRDLADYQTLYCPPDQSYNGKWLQKRNHGMVAQADIVLALWNGQPSSGTASALREARASNKPVFIIRPHLVETYTHDQLNRLKNTRIFTPERVQ